MHPDRLFRWTREAPREWDAALSRIGNLRAAWVSGDARFPVQRWIVFELVPLHRVRSSEAVDLWSDLMPDDEETAWKRATVRATGCMPYAVWVCQGGVAGWPFQYMPDEALRAQGAGMPISPPRPGTLPYQPFHPALMVPQIAERSLRARRHASALAEREARKQQAARDVRNTIVRQVEDEINPVMRDAVPDLVNTGAWTRRVHAGDAPEWERGSADETDAYYVETGRLATAPA